MTSRLTLLVKFLLLMVPIYGLVSAVGVLMIDHKDQNRSEERLALRVDNLSARVASALGRHGARENPQLAEKLLGLLGNEPAVRCAEWQTPETSGHVLACCPPRIGCELHPLVDDAFGGHLGAASLSALLAFRFIIGRPWLRLHQAMMNAPRGRARPMDEPKGEDELAEMIRADNVMVQRERRQEGVLVARNRQLADQKRDPFTGVFNRRYFDQWCQGG